MIAEPFKKALRAHHVLSNFNHSFVNHQRSEQQAIIWFGIQIATALATTTKRRRRKPFLNDTIKGVSKMYSNHLNPGQVWYSNGPNMPGCQMVWFSKGGPKTRLKMSAILSKIQTVHLITWSDHLKTQTKSESNFKISGVWYSNGYYICHPLPFLSSTFLYYTNNNLTIMNIWSLGK